MRTVTFFDGEVEVRREWLIRRTEGDPLSYEVNLEADLNARVPMVVGEMVGRATITETRMHTIRELRKMWFLSLT